MATAFRKKILSNFKLQGLHLHNDATTLLVEVLEPYSDREDVDDIVDQIIEAVQRQPLKTSLVGREVMEVAVEECNQASDSDADKALIAISAFDVPAFAYNNDRKKFMPVPKETLKLYAGADEKAQLFRTRYTVLHQRMLRHELFSPVTMGQEAQQNKFQLKTVEHLLSHVGLPDKVIVLGMLVQLREGKFHLEDLSGTVELDLSQCLFHTGLFVEFSIVLAEGMYSDGVFHLSALGFPPAEPALETRSYFGSVNFFGGPSSSCAKSSVKLQAMLQENQDAMIVFLSDVFLDEPKVMDKLNFLLMGYSEYPPTAIVFMGNFSSAPYGPAKFRKLKASFRALGDLILRFPEVATKSQFFFVPGPQDPGPGNILPRPPIPSVLTSDITDRIANAHFLSNPCHIQFCTREIVVFREDILNKMSRHCIRFPSDDTDMQTHFVKTIFSQSHLCPLPIHSRPIYWMYDHALMLYPLPDLVVIGDKCDPYTVTLQECTVTNPGSFPRCGFEFKAYIPATGSVEDSKIMD